MQGRARVRDNQPPFIDLHCQAPGEKLRVRKPKRLGDLSWEQSPGDAHIKAASLPSLMQPREGLQQQVGVCGAVGVMDTQRAVRASEKQFLQTGPLRANGKIHRDLRKNFLDKANSLSKAR